jgi:hypothetical protein
MFGSLPPAAVAMDMDGNTLNVPMDDVEFETNWAIMEEIRRELEREQLEPIPDEQPEYVPSIDEFNQTQCPICSHRSLYQCSPVHPLTCRQCPFQYSLKLGSLNEVHQYHRRSMADCGETILHAALWNNDDGSPPSLLFVCSKCDFNYCL